MKSNVVIDGNVLSRLLSEVESLVDSSRETLDEIITRNSNISSYEELRKTGDIVRLYGNCADDYAKLCYLQTGVTEAILDLRGARKFFTSETVSVPQTLIKSYKFRIDNTVEQLNLFKDAIQASRLGLEARVRYFNSCAYTSYDKVIGAKC